MWFRFTFISAWKDGEAWKREMTKKNLCKIPFWPFCKLWRKKKHGIKKIIMLILIETRLLIYFQCLFIYFISSSFYKFSWIKVIKIYVYKYKSILDVVMHIAQLKHLCLLLHCLVKFKPRYFFT